MQDLVRVLKYILPYKKNVVKSIICNLFHSFFSLFTLGMIVPFVSVIFGIVKKVETLPEFSFSISYAMNALSYYITQIHTDYGIFYALLLVSALFLFCSLFSNIFRYFGMFFLVPVNLNVVRDMRNELYRKILYLPLSFYTKNKSGDIITRINSDVQNMEILTRNTIQTLFKELVLIVVFLATLIMISPLLTLVAATVFPLIAFVISKIGASISRHSKRGQEQLGNITTAYEESVSGLREIKGFNAIDFFYQKFKKQNRNYTQIMNKVSRKMELMPPLSEVLSVLSVCVVVGIGGILSLNNFEGVLYIDNSLLILFLIVFARLAAPIQTSVRSFGYIKKSLVSARRVFEVIDSEEVILEKPNAVSFDTFKDKIEIKNVSLVYPSGYQALNEVSLTINKGDKIAFVGVSGSGKTTLINLLLRFYDVTLGGILIDNKNIKDYKISDIRDKFGMVSQDVVLFNDTVFENIRFGRSHVTEEDVVRAAQIANAHDFITEMENGYQTMINDRGMNLSGGQRQRLSIARAVLCNPEILLLDEATAALDLQSEQLVQNSIKNAMQGRTSITIAHRLSTIKKANIIFVFQKGKIVEQGNHDILMKQKGIYAKLINLQCLTKDED